MKYLIDSIVSTSLETIDILKAYKNAWDALILYFEYIRHSRMQASNKIRANRKFLRKWLWWWDDRIQNAKKVLKQEGLIEEVSERKKNWTVDYRIIVFFALNKTKEEESTVGEFTAHGEPAHGLYKEENNIFIKENFFYEKEQEKNIKDGLLVVGEDTSIYSIEEFRKYINKWRLQEEFFYKIGDEESYDRTTTEFFLFCEDSWKILKKKTAESRFRYYLKPKWETEEQRNQLKASYFASRKKKNIKNSRIYEENKEKKKKEDEEKLIKEYEKTLTEWEKKSIIDEAEKYVISLIWIKNKESLWFRLLVQKKYKSILFYKSTWQDISCN